MNGKTTPNEADVLAQNQALTTANADLTTKLTAANTALGTITGERDKLKTDLTSAQGQVTELTGKLTKSNEDLAAMTRERDALKAEKTTLDAAVASELAKRGISPKAATAAGATDAKKGDDSLVSEYEAAKNDPKLLAGLLNDPVKGPALRKLLI